MKIYTEIVRNNGIMDRENLTLLDESNLISAYNYELLLRAYNNSKKCIVTKDLSDFSVKEKSTKIVKGIYFNSQKISQINLNDLSTEEKEDVIAAILEALENPQNKYAICSEENIYLTKSKKQFSFLHTMLKLPSHDYKVLFKIHDDSLNYQDWSALLFKIFKESYSSFITKYGT